MKDCLSTEGRSSTNKIHALSFYTLLVDWKFEVCTHSWLAADQQFEVCTHRLPPA